MTSPIKTTLWTTAAAVALFAATAVVPAVRAADDKPASTQPTTKPAVATNTKCPITGEDIDPKVTAVYQGKTYAFCCGDCVASFNKDPAKYAAKAK